MRAGSPDRVSARAAGQTSSGLRHGAQLVCHLDDTQSQIACATEDFEPLSTPVTGPSGARITTSFAGLPKTFPALTSLTTRRSQPLRASLARAWSSTDPAS